MNEAPFAFPVELCEFLTKEGAELGIALFYADGVVDDRIQELPIDVLPLGASESFDIAAYRRLREAVDDYDVLHTHPNGTGVLARLACSSKDVAIVDTKHNDHSHFSRLQRYPNALGNQVCDLVVANSRTTLSRLPWYETIRIDTTVIYNGVATDRIRAIEPEPFSRPTIVSTARQVPQKDLPTLIRSMHVVRSSCPEAQLVLIGPGDQQNELIRLVKEESLESHVTFAGYLPTREEVFEFVTGADVFALSSIYEGFGVAVVEAMAAGTPVVVSDIDVMREVVGPAGIYASVGDQDEFADGILRLLNSKTERVRRGNQLSERAETTFDVATTAEKYLSAYHQAV